MTLTEILAKADEVLDQATDPLARAWGPHRREIDLALALKAAAEALEEIYAEANRQLLTMQSDSAESRDVLLWNERGLAVEDIRAAIERRLAKP